MRAGPVLAWQRPGRRLARREEQRPTRKRIAAQEAEAVTAMWATV
jgi:hypothetical protein